MELIYGCTQAFCDCVRDLPKQEKRAIAKAINGFGELIFQDQDLAQLKLLQPARLILKHGYTPTLGILPVAENAHVLLCYDYDAMNDKTLISLLDVAPEQQSRDRFFILVKAIYGPLLLKVQ